MATQTFRRPRISFRNWWRLEDLRSCHSKSCRLWSENIRGSTSTSSLDGKSTTDWKGSDMRPNMPTLAWQFSYVLETNFDIIIYFFFLDIAPGCIFLKRLSEIRSAVCGCRFQGCWLTKTHSQQLSFVELKVTLSDSRPLSHWKEDSRSLQDKKLFMFITLCCLMIENSTVILLFDLSYSM